jgi:hypothetical protein
VCYLVVCVLHRSHAEESYGVFIQLAAIVRNCDITRLTTG